MHYSQQESHTCFNITTKCLFLSTYYVPSTILGIQQTYTACYLMFLARVMLSLSDEQEDNIHFTSAQN